MAVEPRDRGHRDLLEGSYGRPERPDESPRPGRVEVPHRRHVDPRRERAPRSLEDDDAELRIGTELPEGGAEGVDEGRREDVQRRAGQREAGDAALAREAQIRHAALVAAHRRIHRDRPAVDPALAGPWMRRSTRFISASESSVVSSWAAARFSSPSGNDFIVACTCARTNSS